MSDVWAAFPELDASAQERLAGDLETRGAAPQQREMRRTFLADVPFPDDARVLEVGCGTGVLTRALALRPDVGEVVGVDTAPSLLSKARDLAVGLPDDLTFLEADGRSLPFEDGTFDVVVFFTTLTHVPGPERALAQALRVLRPQGWLAIFDGDYPTTTVALGDHDPLQACVDATMVDAVHNRWLARRLPALVGGCGFETARFRGHGYVETTEAGYMLTVVDRSIDNLRASGRVGEDAAAALKAEARERIEAGTFFGHIAYVNFAARKSGQRFAPSVALKSFTEELSEPDRRFLEEEARKRGAAEVMSTLVEACRQGGGEVVLEYRLWGLPWGFSPEEVAVPVHIWHGEDDLVVPLDDSRHLAGHLPRADLHMLKDSGHLSILRHFGPILDTLFSE